MTFKLVFEYYLLGLAVVAVKASDSEITKFMKHFKVIPDVIDVGPKNFLKITYENGIQADKGVELSPTQVKNQPNIEWQAEAGTYYTLIMTDPDSRADKKTATYEYVHWIVGNIPGDVLSKGEVLAEYVGSETLKGAGSHRYTFLLFKQPKKREFQEKHINKKQTTEREKFSTKNFIKKYNLEAPIAGNFFQIQHDGYVSALHKQLGISKS